MKSGTAHLCQPAAHGLGKLPLGLPAAVHGLACVQALLRKHTPLLGDADALVIEALHACMGRERGGGQMSGVEEAEGASGKAVHGTGDGHHGLRGPARRTRRLLTAWTCPFSLQWVKTFSRMG